MRRACAPLVLISALSGALFLCACGDDPRPVDPVLPDAIEPPRIEVGKEPRPGVEPPPLQVTGQEVWIKYRTGRDDKRPGAVVQRELEHAREIALGLYARARKGEDIGRLARRYSDAPGAVADGFTGWWPVVPQNRDPRDKSLRACPPGELTPLIPWQGGFWFARRSDAAEARQLWLLFEAWRRRRVKLEVIYLAHRGVEPVWLGVDAKVPHDREQALALANRLIAQLRNGADFGALSEKYSSHDPLRKRKGRVTFYRGRDKPRDPWAGWGEPGLPLAVKAAAFDDKYPVGHIIARVFDTPRGFYIVKVVDRKV